MLYCSKFLRSRRVFAVSSLSQSLANKNAYLTRSSFHFLFSNFFLKMNSLIVGLFIFVPEVIYEEIYFLQNFQYKPCVRSVGDSYIDEGAEIKNMTVLKCIIKTSSLFNKL